MDIPKTVDFYFNPDNINDNGHVYGYPVDPKKPSTATAARKHCGLRWEKETFENEPTSVRAIRSMSIGHQSGVEVLIHSKFLVTIHHVDFVEIVLNCKSQDGVFENVIVGRPWSPLTLIANEGPTAIRVREEEIKELEKIKPASQTFTFNRLQVGNIYTTSNFGSLICLAKGVAGIELDEDKTSTEDQVIFTRTSSWGHKFVGLYAFKTLTALETSEYATFGDIVPTALAYQSSRGWMGQDEKRLFKAFLNLFPEKFKPGEKQNIEWIISRS